MKLHLVEQAIDRFLNEEKGEEWIFPHSLVDRFHQHWAGATETNLAEIYAICLQSDISQSWWKRENYRPREIMLQLMEIDPVLSWVAWKNLGDETVMLDGRIDRFQYYFDTIIKTMRKANPLNTWTYHHQDARIISLYLSGMFPEKYALYPGLASFVSFCKSVESPQIPVVDDLNRYAKVSRILYQYLVKHPGFEIFLSKRREQFPASTIIPFQTVYEVISFR